VTDRRLPQTWLTRFLLLLMVLPAIPMLLVGWEFFMASQMAVTLGLQLPPRERLEAFYRCEFTCVEGLLFWGTDIEAAIAAHANNIALIQKLRLNAVKKVQALCTCD
jgi:hypothetical protein